MYEKQPVKKLTLPLSEKTRLSLRTGEIIALSGVVYTARDAAHKRIAALLAQGAVIPIALKDSAVYYCGPTPTREGEIIGSCGPTTSARMDDYTPLFLQHGMTVMIGKGKRSDEVNRAIANHRAVYFAAVGGAGALYKSCVKACRCVAFEDLGCEAVYELQIKNMQVVVATDAYGKTCLK